MSIFTGKKTKYDYYYLKKLDVILPIKKYDLRYTDYSPINKKFTAGPDKEYKYYLYDKMFLFLYNRSIDYTRTLDLIDKIHEKFGYLTTITPEIISKNLKLNVNKVNIILHCMRRRGLIFLKGKDYYQIHDELISRTIIKQMFSRHPIITKDKPLGYLNGK